MKKLILTVILSFFLIKSHAQFNYDPSLKHGGDKILHFAGSYVISYNSYKFLLPRYGEKKAKLYSSLISIGVGITKEIIDEKYRKGWEVEDMYANAGGILLFRVSIND